MSEAKSSNTGTMAMVVAAVLLLVIGAMVYNDHVNKKFEEKWAEREAQAAATGGNPNNPAQVNPNAQGFVQNQVPVNPNQNPNGYVQQPPAQGQAYQQNGQPYVQNGQVPPNYAQQQQPNPNYVNQQQPQQQPYVQNQGGVAQPQQPVVQRQTPPQVSVAPVVDPELEKMRQELAAAKARSQAQADAEAKIAANLGAGGGTSAIAPPVIPTDTVVNEQGGISTGISAVPSAVESAKPFDPARYGAGSVVGPPAPGGPMASAQPAAPTPNPAETEALQQQIKNSPALAKVLEYDVDWGFVTIDAGKGQNIKKDQRFAVRRGSLIMGWVKVDAVDENVSYAKMVTSNKMRATNRKPQVGDDLIAFELF